MTPKKVMLTLVLSLVMAFISPQSFAALTYEAVDVPDPVAGVDRMKYVYHLNGAFPTFYGFNLIYDSSHYANLDVTVPLGSDWFGLPPIQPDASAPLDGLLTYTAQTDIADATSTFEVEFDWLGSGTPGSQPYEIFDDGFNIVSTARTTEFGVNTVPEPATLALVVTALLALLMRHFRRRPAILPLLVRT